MHSVLRLALFAVGGYLLGSFPTGVVLSRSKFRIDVREMGSGNIGATNITRVFGWGAGATTLVVDFLKGFIPLALLQKYAPEWRWEATVLGLSLVLGHCYSLYLGFRGGKGVATSLGCLLVAAPVLAISCVPIYGLLLFITKISAVGSLGCVGVALIYTLFVQPQGATLVLIMGVSALILLRHKDNIRRLARDLRREKKA